MLLVSIKNLKPGLVLAKPVYNPKRPSKDLLRRGFKLTSDIIGKLKKIGVPHIWVVDNDLDFLDEMVNEKLEVIKRGIKTHIEEIIGEGLIEEILLPVWQSYTAE